uniref:Uncharacterized protein n=1 Tax=mine drainage metagenome TaxID=410659 RepID=E6PXN9_9ZZZZ
MSGLRCGIHLCLRPIQSVPQLQVRGNEVDESRRQIPVKLICRTSYGQRRRQRGVLAILQLLRDDVHANLVIVDVGDGQQDGALPQVRRKFFEHVWLLVKWVIWGVTLSSTAF